MASFASLPRSVLRPAGTPGDDSLTGTVGNDTLTGDDGNDTLDGLLGDDWLLGGNGNDSLLGGDGNDTLDAGTGIDWLSGDLGDDTLLTTSGTVTMVGGDGADQLTSNATFTPGSVPVGYYYGGDGNDTITSGAGADALLGEGGDDSLLGGQRRDFISGGIGADFIDGGSDLNASDSLLGGDGNDTVFGYGHLHGNNGDDVLWLRGGKAYGEAGNDILRGIVGDRHELYGGDGNDLLQGGTGIDTLDGGTGLDTLEGGDGDDFYVIDGNDVVTELANAGYDIVDSSLGAYALGANVEGLRLLAATAQRGYGNALDNTFWAGAGDNVMGGGAGNDTVTYEYATVGVDVWLALTGAQTTGGSGTDTLLSIENLTGGNGNDRLRGNALDNVLDGNYGDDTLEGGAGNDTLFADGGNDVLRGGAGEDTADFNDTQYQGGVSWYLAKPYVAPGSLTLIDIENLAGSTGNDTFLGNGWDNVLDGRAGNDTLRGGGGADDLVGGDGADLFIYTAVGESTLTHASRDTIADFDGSEGDRIDLHLIDADAVVAGNQAFAFIGSAAFSADATGQLRYDAGVLYASTDADADAEFAITLSGAPALVAGDFLL